MNRDCHPRNSERLLHVHLRSQTASGESNENQVPKPGTLIEEHTEPKRNTIRESAFDVDTLALIQACLTFSDTSDLGLKITIKTL